MLCTICGVLSLIFANGAGSYIFQLMDSFAGNYTLLIIAFCEVSLILKIGYLRILFEFFIPSVLPLVMSMV